MANPTERGDLAARHRAARARYEQLVARAQWWDRWRGLLVGPLILAGAGVGAGIALGFRQLMALPPQAEAYAAVVGVVTIGRWAHRHFHTRRLEVAGRVMKELERELRGNGGRHSQSG